MTEGTLPEETIPDRRRRLLLLHPDVVLDMLKDSHAGRAMKILEHALPDDVQFLGCHFAWERNMFAIAIESESFDKVAQGCHLPVHPDMIVETVEPKEGEANDTQRR